MQALKPNGDRVSSVKLVVIQPGAVRLAGDQVECFPLTGSLPAITCVKRQQAAQLTMVYPTCRNCADGRTVARKLGIDIGDKSLVASFVKTEERKKRAGRKAHATAQEMERRRRREAAEEGGER